jgi:pimeloyl-ACP methyl ester carboxylesterase
VGTDERIVRANGIAQRIAVCHPDRVASLTLISTSPGPGPDLPPAAERVRRLFAEPPPAPDWTDRAAVVGYMVEGERAFAGAHPVDEDRVREIAGRAFDRTRDMAASQTNHWIIDGGGPVRSGLGGIAAPTLVIHGTADPLFPLGHAEALAREIPGAELLALGGTGHQMPPPHTWDSVVAAILRVTSRGYR